MWLGICKSGIYKKPYKIPQLESKHIYQSILSGKLSRKSSFQSYIIVKNWYFFTSGKRVIWTKQVL